MDEHIFSFSDDEAVVPELAIFFGIESTRESLKTLADEHELDEDERTVFFQAMRDIIIGKMELDDLAGVLMDGTTLEPEMALELQADVFEKLLSDIEDKLELQRGIYQDLHPEEFLPPKPPEADPAEVLAEEIIAKNGPHFDDEMLQKRLKGIAAAFLKDVRDEAETVTMFEKPAKTGGLALPAEKYMPLLLMLKEAKPGLGQKKEALDAEKKAWAERYEKAKVVKAAREAELAAAAAPIAAPLLNGVAEQADEETTAAEEVPQPPVAVEPSMPAVVEPAPSALKPTETSAPVAAPPVAPEPAAPLAESLPVKPPPPEYSALSDDALKSVGLTLGEDDLRRYRNAADLFFRDLRDSIETKSKFSMPSVSGGIGLTDAQADMLMAELARLAANQRAALKEKLVEEKRQFVSGNVEKLMTEEDRLESAESASLDRMYGQIAAKATASAPKATVAVQPAKPSASPAPKMIPVISLDEKKKAAVPAMASAAPSPVPAPRAPLPAPAAPSRPSEPRPTVSDIKFTPKLTGPIEELKSLAVVDFRRLSRDPHEATLKIKDKIDLLAEQSFEAKIAGVRAWQDSDTNRLYLDMLRKSLEGKPILEIISEREATNEPVLSKAEFEAIMELNRKLRFG